MMVLSPAKINLMLRILGQRLDGYHLLQTYFQLLNWGDQMEFDLIDTDEIKIYGEFNGISLENNIIYQAVQLLKPFRHSTKGLSIHVEKLIPQGSGLGGGSSNAGTTLTVLNKLWQCNLTDKKLMELAVTLGADVPVFVLNQSAMAEGIGEKLQPYNIENYSYVLIFPDTNISTVEVFQQQSLQRNQQMIEISKINKKNYWTNACLPVVLENYPVVKKIYSETSQFATIYLSGTGSTLFACFENVKKALIFQQKCSKNVRTILCDAK